MIRILDIVILVINYLIITILKTFYFSLYE